MLREINRIARQMLFLQGHLTRPQDFAGSPGAGRKPEPRSDVRKSPRSRALRLATACLACATPMRYVTGQIR